MGQADPRPAISDGGSEIEDWLRTNVPRVEAVIPDRYHAAEHLSDWAKALRPTADEATAVATEWCHRLKHEGTVDVCGRSAAVQEAQVLTGCVTCGHYSGAKKASGTPTRHPWPGKLYQHY